MKIHHKSLSQGRWFELSFAEQMANIGSEVFRTISAKKRGDENGSKLAFERALELLDLALTDKKNISRLRELTRLRETLVDYFVFDNEYRSTDKLWENYFFAFTYLARINH